MEIKTISAEIDNFIYKLEPEIQAKVLRTLDLLEKYENRLGMPYSKSLHKGLFELRISGSKPIRIIYCFKDKRIYLLNIFIKKSNKISPRELDLANKRYKSLA